MTQSALERQKRRFSGRKPKQIILDHEDEQLLQGIVDSPYLAPWQRRRAQIVLGLAAGERVWQVLERLQTSRASVKRVRRMFMSEGVAGLLRRWHRKMRPREHYEAGEQ